MRNGSTIIGSMIAAVLLIGAWCVPAEAFNTGKPLSTPGANRPADQAPADLAGVDIEEHLDTALPLDLVFRDETGAPVRLGSLYDGNKPVILTLGYYECPMLCSLVLNGMLDGVRNLDLRLGQDFKVVTVSIDPTEGPELAAKKKKTYLESYGDDADPAGWRFLTGDAESIRKLADAVGFRYEYLPRQKQFAHAAVLTVTTPDARISRYLYGVRFSPQTMRLTLLDAGKGKIGNTIDRILLTCYHFDASAGTYSLQAMKVMRLGGFLTLIIVGFFVGIFWIRELRRRRSAVKEART